MKTKKTPKISSKLKVGDRVIVISGNNKGQQGEILRRNSDKVVIQGINMRKKHIKKSQQNPQGSIVEIECPIHISNVMLCVKDKPVRLKTKINNDGSKSLVYKDENQEVVYRELKKARA